MPTLATFAQTMNIPTPEDLGITFPNYKPFALNEGKQLFELITAPKQLLKAQIATEDLELPAVAGIAQDCAHFHENGGNDLTPFRKQFIGAVLSVAMELNGFRKTGKKRSIPHHAFNKGEMYERVTDTQSETANSK